jgi:hypothetical protein
VYSLFPDFHDVAKAQDIFLSFHFDVVLIVVIYSEVSLMA